MIFGKLVLSAATLALTAFSAATCKPKGNEKSFIVFGNSASDIGNKLAIFGQPAYWEGRFSNGPVWNEYAAHLLNMPLVNYAIGGATSSNTALVNGTKNGEFIPSLLDQIDDYLKNTTNTVKHPEKSIVTLEVGGNNILWPLYVDPNYILTNKAKFISVLVDDIIAGLQKVYNAGYRQFLIWDVPALYKGPILEGKGEVVAMVKGLLDEVNAKLDGAINDFEAKNKPEFIKLFNTTSIFNTIEDPAVLSAINVTDTTTACVQSDSGMYKPDLEVCKNGDQHFFYDLLHPSTRTHHCIGVAAVETFKHPKKEITADLFVKAAKKYNIGQVTAENNILAKAGVHNVPQYPKKK
ncbi:hypothetical protein H4219_005610 [Mycoemilia scoparia]|uniref:Uncharacterized protein n=1 Tax=Mycoemilia scoparia TaxID=417184 RepID=A0A9W7ZNN8_9FUNG|nr:hypothetical protein H4219_005610 [Mycoemilia scoparia]